MRYRSYRAKGSGSSGEYSGDMRKLRNQARKSAKVRSAVAQEIQLEQALHATLGNAPLPTSQIVGQATAGGARRGIYRSSAIGSMAGWLVMLMVTVALPFVVVSMLPTPEIQPEQIPRPANDPGMEMLRESSAAERIEPRELDPRFVDDDSSPSDRMHRAKLAVPGETVQSEQSEKKAGKLPRKSSQTAPRKTPPR